MLIGYITQILWGFFFLFLFEVGVIAEMKKCHVISEAFVLRKYMGGEEIQGHSLFEILKRPLKDP